MVAVERAAEREPGVEGLPQGSLLALPALGAVAAFTLLPLLLAAALLALGRFLGPILPAAAGVLAAGLLAFVDPGEAWKAYVEHAPVWRLSDVLTGEADARALLPSVPLIVAAGAFLAGVLALWESARRPFWVERPPRRRVLASARHRRARRRFAAGALPADGRIPLGLGEADVPVYLTADELAQHTLLVGATGSGKTTTLVQLLRGLAANGAGLVVVDLKADPALERALARIAESYASGFELWTFKGPAFWNPLAHGDATEMADKLIGLEEWTEPHYKRAAQRHLHTVLSLLEQAGERADLARVAELVQPASLDAFLHGSTGRTIAREERERVERFLDGLDRSSLSAIQGLGNRLALLAETRAGTQLRDAPDAIDLHQALIDRRVVLFSLDAQKYGETAAQTATLVAQDMKTVAAERLAASGHGEELPPAYFAIDEFSAVRSDRLVALLARGRSARVGVVLATQELADLARVASGFADQVLGNTNVKLVHRQDVPESAERLAGVAGTRSVWEETFQTERQPFVELAGRLLGGGRGGQTGQGTIRQVEQYVVHPNVLKRLPQGTAVLIRKHPRVAVERVRILPACENANQRDPRQRAPSRLVSILRPHGGRRA